MKTSILIFIFTLSISTSWARCKIPKGEKLVLACTDECDFKTRARLKTNALLLGYSLKIVNLKDAASSVDEALKKVDAVVVPGGADIDPAFYLENVTPELQNYTRQNLHLVKFTDEGKRRDKYEYDVVTHYSSDEDYKNLPLLGICRGMQMMTVAQGIPLYLDIKSELEIENRIMKLDRIYVNDEPSLMNTLYGDKSFRGFQLHHQGLRVDYYQKYQGQYPKTRVTAYSNNNLIAEAIEYTHRPALGVQYHPESSWPGTSKPIFKWLLERACDYKNLKVSHE